MNRIIFSNLKNHLILLIKYKILKWVAPAHFSISNPEKNVGAFSDIDTALAKLPTKNTNLLTIPNTLVNPQKVQSKHHQYNNNFNFYFQLQNS